MVIYTIQNGGMAAKIDSLGANLISLSQGGDEFIWQRDPAYWTGSAPVLFPVVGRNRDGVITVGGRAYPMPKHGFVHDAEHTLAEQEENAVTFRYSSCPRTREMYPWEFDFETGFTLKDGVLDTAFRITNRDQHDMYFCVGGHPAFNVPLTADERFEDWQLEFEKEEALATHPMQGEMILSQTEPVPVQSRILPLRRSLFNKDALILDRLESNWVKMYSKHTGRGVQVTFSDFNTLGIWTRAEPSDAPYVCIEPWIGMGFRDDEPTAALEERYDVQKLAPGQTVCRAFQIRILP